MSPKIWNPKNPTPRHLNLKTFLLLHPVKNSTPRNEKKQEAERRKIRSRIGKVKDLIRQTENKSQKLILDFEQEDIASDYVKLQKLSAQIDATQHELEVCMED